MGEDLVVSGGGGRPRGRLIAGGVALLLVAAGYLYLVRDSEPPPWQGWTNYPTVSTPTRTRTPMAMTGGWRRPFGEETDVRALVRAGGALWAVDMETGVETAVRLPAGEVTQVATTEALSVAVVDGVAYDIGRAGHGPVRPIGPANRVVVGRSTLYLVGTDGGREVARPVPGGPAVALAPGERFVAAVDAGPVVETAAGSHVLLTGDGRRELPGRVLAVDGGNVALVAPVGCTADCEVSLVLLPAVQVFRRERVSGPLVGPAAVSMAGATFAAAVAVRMDDAYGVALLHSDAGTSVLGDYPPVRALAWMPEARASGPSGEPAAALLVLHGGLSTIAFGGGTAMAHASPGEVGPLPVDWDEVVFAR